jgi:hypothetical protein
MRKNAMNAWNVSIATIRAFAKILKPILRPYLEMVWAFLLENGKNRTKGENSLAIRTKQVQNRVSLLEMVQIFKSLSPTFQAFRHAKV